MNTCHRRLTAALVLSLATTLSATTRFVNVNSTTPSWPYTDWGSAATTIQDAIDVADAGDLILVTNGVYATGERVMYGAMANRVAIDRAVTVRSVNGPAVTVIQGYQVPGTTNGDGAVRCAYLADGGILSGFTLTNGATRSAGDSNKERNGGGVWCASTNAVVTNCMLNGNSAYRYGGGAYSGTLYDCTLVRNSASSSGGGTYAGRLNKCMLAANRASSYGGGASGGTLTNCTLAGNQAGSGGGGAYSSTIGSCVLSNNYGGGYGGGAYYGTLSNCRLTGNSASRGGGASQTTLDCCMITRNSATYGGGADKGSLTNCTVVGNSATTGGGTHYSDVFCSLLVSNAASSYGGGAAYGYIRNSALTRNRAMDGGGAFQATLANCTVTGNTAAGGAGGTFEGTLRNCILWFNGETDIFNSSVVACCSPTLFASGSITNEPQLASSSHLSANSPCRGAGNPAYATGTDIDGEAWANPPSIGCDEFSVGNAIGQVSVGIQMAYTNVAPGFSVGLTGFIDGWVTASRWEFGDGTILSNRPYGASHAWNTPGDHPFVLRAYNDSNPGGITATAIVHVVEEVHYVAIDNTAPQSPYDSWPAAATNIQDAVDAAVLPGALILVSNGVYRTGGRVQKGLQTAGALTNRLAVNKPVVVQSMDGPAATLIEGYQVPDSTLGDAAARCVYLGNGASLSGFTLTNGGTRLQYGMAEEESMGGGVWCASGEVVSNCVLVGNAAHSGGGAAGATLINCTVSGNLAADSGGGAYASSLEHCSLTGNSATSGGGALGSTLRQCTLIANSASSSGGGVHSATVNNSALWSNMAADGGGAHSSTLNNCTVTYNSAFRGGGSFSNRTANCIVYYNTAVMDSNCRGGDINYTCTTPLPSVGVGNKDSDPQLAGTAQLSTASPCRSAGNPNFAIGTDLDGEAWANPPSMGCDEYYAGARTGTLSAKIDTAHTKIAVGFNQELAATINGALTASRWEFGDGTVLSNRPTASHSWNAPGDYAVVLRAYNNSNPGGVMATAFVQVVTQPVHYVAVNNPAPSAPYDSWARAATSIQDAVDAANVPGALVLVSNGIYASGGKALFGAMSNRVAVTMPLHLRSVNGPAVTIIEGNQPIGDTAVRCAYLTDGATLSGFTLTKGATRDNGDRDQEQSGAGVWCNSISALVSNCVLAGNSARIWGGAAYSGTLWASTLETNLGGYYDNYGGNGGGGGGAYGAILNSCLIRSNSTGGLGGGGIKCVLTDCMVEGNSSWGTACGGAYACMLDRCTLLGNSAVYGGGAQYSALNGCALISNNAVSAGGGAYGCTLDNCLLTGNSSYDAGGGLNGTFNNCILATNGAWFGGGVSRATLNNCLLIGNTAGYGGGTDGGYLTNCTLVANRASEQGGGARYSTLCNSIAYYNVAPNGSNYYSGCYLTNCCTAPLPPQSSGTSNFTKAPLFVDMTGGNLRLQSNSPCINAGRNDWAANTSDLDGRPRIVAGCVDVGAYEFQADVSGAFIGWLEQYGLPKDGAADFVDTDLDGHNNWQEWRADTVPTNALSRLALLSPTNAPTGLAVTWQSVPTRSYFLERGTNVAGPPPIFAPLATGIPGQSGTTTFTDTAATNGGPFFYRVGVQP